MSNSTRRWRAPARRSAQQPQQLAVWTARPPRPRRGPRFALAPLLALALTASLLAVPGLRQTPTEALVTLGGISFTQISAGSNHTCGVAVNANAYCWGDNGAGQLGDGTTTNRTIPTAVSGLTSVAQTSAGDSHTCAVTTGGSAYCWGSNGSGRLGDGTTTNRATPTVVSGLTSVAQINSGGEHTCAVTTSGTPFCWGSNGDGRLGDGTTTNRHTPTTVSGLPPVAQLSAGRRHTCAVTTGGNAYCWGWNFFGQVGDGTTTNRGTPTAVSGLPTTAKISAGSRQTCAVTASGIPYCWGFNGGRLGDGTTTDRHTPTTVSGLSSVAEISTSGNGAHTCAVVTGGTAYCWGFNEFGQLGDGTTTDRHTPTTVSGSRSVAQISVGREHTCATTTRGEAFCWGRNHVGQLGDDTTTHRHTPTPVAAVQVPPGAPTLVSPEDGESFGVAQPQAFTIKALDPNGDPYVGEVVVTNPFTGARITEFPTSPALSGMNSSGTPIGPLPPGTYLWKARAQDPSGSGEFGAFSGTRTVEVKTHGPGCELLDALVDGYVGDTYLQVAAGQPDPDTAQVCLRADDGGPAGIGGVLTVSAPDGVSAPQLGTDPSACESMPTTPLTHPLLAGELGNPNNPPTHVQFMGDVRVDGNTIVVCVSAGNGGTDDNLVARSITITVPGAQAIPDVRFAPLDDEPLPAPRAHPDPSAPSASCQAASGSTRLLNLGIDGVHTWLYTHVAGQLAVACVRVEGPVDAGLRLGVDASGSGIDPVVDVLTVPHADCTEQVVNLTNPVRVRVFHSAAGANPAALCVGLATADTGVRIGTDGDPGAPAPIVEPD